MGGIGVAPVATSGVAIVRVGADEMAVDISMLHSLGRKFFTGGTIALSDDDFAHWRRAHDIAGVVSQESLRASAKV